MNALRQLLLVMATIAGYPPPALAQPTAPPSGMVYIPGGRFTMGTNEGYSFEGPEHIVEVSPFWIDRTEVTVAEFARFVDATGHVTTVEQVGESRVFDPEQAKWRQVKGVNWRCPDAPGVAADPREPVTQVSWDDATAYALWAGKRLPTEAEWEYAARGRYAGKLFCWGDQLAPRGRMLANYWQGSFPQANTRADGYVLRAPVASFPPNTNGVYDMTGNVWEWCSDWWDKRYYSISPLRNPRGPDTGTERVVRGGSFLCSENYCTGFRIAARNKREPAGAANNVGFRCLR